MDDSWNRLQAAGNAAGVWMLVVFEELCIGSPAVTVFLCISFQELIEFSCCIDLALDNSDLKGTLSLSSLKCPSFGAYEMSCLKHI